MNERLDPPEPTEAGYDVYLTYHVRVMATSEDGAVDEAKLCLSEGSLVDFHVETCVDEREKRDDV